jgi:O-antigen/teichoic acid export membrane protein
VADGDGRPAGLRSRAVGGLFWMVSGAGMQALLRLVLILVLARLLGPEVFGIAGAALVVVNLSLVLSQLGIGSALVQRETIDERDIRTGFTAALIAGALVTGLVQLMAPAITEFFDFEGLTEVIRVLALTSLIQSAGLVAEAVCRRELRFRRLAALGLGSFALGYGVLGLGLAILDAGVWALVGAHLAQVMINTVGLLWSQPHPKRPMLNRVALPRIIFYSGGFTTWRIGSVVAQNIDNVVVGRWLGAEALGLYGRAYQLTTAPATILGKGVGFVLFPIMAKIQNDRPRVGAAYRDGVELMALLTLPISVLVAVLAPEIVLVLLGRDWTGVIVPLQILAAGIFLRLNSRLSDSLVIALGQVYAISWRQWIYAAAVFAGSLLGQTFGLPGVAAGVLAALLLNLALTVQLSVRLTSLRPADLASACARPVLVAALFGSVLGAAAATGRMHDIHPGLTLGLALVLGLLTAFAVIRFRNGALIGPRGRWLLGSLAQRAPRRFARFGRWFGVASKEASTPVS